MKTRIRTYLWIGIWAALCICAGEAQAQSCHFNLKFKLANGETICLSGQKFANETPRKQLFSIERLARNANNYYLAKSIDERCQSWGFVDVASMVQQISDKISPPRTAFDNAKKSALSECESSGCRCQILIDDGTANSAHPEYARIFDKVAPSQTQVAAGLEKENKANGNINPGQLAQQSNPGLTGLSSTPAKPSQSTSDPTPPGLVDEQRIAAEVRARLEALLMVEAREREVQRLAAQAKVREEQRLTAEAKAREEQRLAAEAKSREEQRLAEARAKEEQRLAADAKAREEQRLASEAKKELELANLRTELEKMRRQSAQAETTTVLARRKALVIGNDSYKYIRPLSKAVADARAMAESLERVGYSVTLKTNLTEREMKTTLRTFKSEVEAGDEVTFFFAGHGVELSKENYLIPVDVTGDNPDQVKDETIALQRILDDMSERKVKLTLALIDACRNNPFKSSGRNIGSGRGLAPTTPATGQMVVFSAGTGQEALDELGPADKNKNGVFTRVFIKEMLKPDRTVDAVTRDVREEVVRLAKSVNHEQVPAIYDQVVGRFYFSRTTAR